MIVTMYTAIVLLVPVCNVWLLQCTDIVLLVPVCNVWLLQCTNHTLHTGTRRTIAVYIVTIIHYILEQEEQYLYIVTIIHYILEQEEQ
jgi:hypothetical protein